MAESKNDVKGTIELSKGVLVYISIDKLKHHPENPRKDLGDLTELSDSIKKKIVSMTKTLQNGDIDASPLMVNKFGCSYCPYFAVCKREYKESDVEKSKLKHNDVMNILKGGDEDEREKMDSFAGRCD